MDKNNNDYYVPEIDLTSLARYKYPESYRVIFDLIFRYTPAGVALIFRKFDHEKTLTIAGIGVERKIKGIVETTIDDESFENMLKSAEGTPIADQTTIKAFWRNLTAIKGIKFLSENINELRWSLISLRIRLDGGDAGLLVLLGFSNEELLTSGHMPFIVKISEALRLIFAFDKLREENLAIRERIAVLNNIAALSEDDALFAGTVSASFSSVFTKGGGFDELIITALSYLLAISSCSIHITIYNMFLEQIASDDKRNDLELPDSVLEMIKNNTLTTKSHSRLIDCNEQSICILPVQYSGTVKGFIAIWFPHRTELMSKEKIIIESFASFVTFEWMKRAAINEQNQILKSEILADILSGRQDDTILSRVKRYGFESMNRFFVIMASVPGVKNHMLYCEKAEGHGLLMGMDAAVNARTLKCMIVPEHNDICIIISCQNYKNIRYDNIVNEIIVDFTKIQENLLLGGSRIYETIHNIKKCYSEADQCLFIIKRYFRHRKFANFIDIGVLRLLLTHRNEDVDAYLEDMLGTIVEYDKSHSTDLLKTLFYYTRLNKSIQHVSQKLNIHPNTIYQRITRIEDLLGYDFSDPMDWLDIQTASILYGLIHTDLIKNIY